MMRRLFISLFALASQVVPARGETPAFRVWFDGGVRAEAARGRLCVFLIREGARVPPRAEPGDGPFYEDPQPIFGVDVASLPPGATMDVGRGVAGFPCAVDDLPAGSYRAQAVLDVNPLNSDWRREPGNLFSEVVSVTKRADEAFTVDLPLTEVVEAEPPAALPGGVWFEVRSALLSDFRKEDVMLRAGVIRPEGFDPAKTYGAVYVVPGFSGDHRFANAIVRMGAFSPYGGELRKHAFIIVLDPESPNGHTLFADSENNGPCGRALVSELIPALEEKFPIDARPGARVITGHSSGGWASIWLAITYPETFGHCFAGSPDPVDFRAFQKVNIYGQDSFYVDATGKEIASNEQGGVALMTIRQENAWEDARGPFNTSGQQWDSWWAVFGPRGERGPRGLFDEKTGAIDKDALDAFRRYDISDLVARNPDRLGPIFRDRVRIIVGGIDEWNLNAAVELLRGRLESLGYPMDGKAGVGRITVVPNTNHGTVMMTPEYRAMGAEMAEAMGRGEGKRKTESGKRK